VGFAETVHVEIAEEGFVNCLLPFFRPQGLARQGFESPWIPMLARLRIKPLDIVKVYP